MSDDDDPKKVLKEVEEIVTRMNRLEQSILERLDNLEHQMEILLEGKCKNEKPEAKLDESQEKAVRYRWNQHRCKDCGCNKPISNRWRCTFCDEYTCYDCYEILFNQIACKVCNKMSDEIIKSF